MGYHYNYNKITDLPYFIILTTGSRTEAILLITSCPATNFIQAENFDSNFRR